MELTTESRQHIEQVAGEALTQLDSIANAAKRNLQDSRTLGPDVLASVNTMTLSSAIQKLDQISQANRDSYQVLAAEPAIARVVVVDEEGKERTYYICRTKPVSGFQNLASYRARLVVWPLWRSGLNSPFPMVSSSKSWSEPNSGLRLWQTAGIRAIPWWKPSISDQSPSSRCERY